MARTFTPDQLAAAVHNTDALKEIVIAFWQPAVSKSLLTLAQHLNSLGLQDAIGDSWDTDSVFHFMAEMDCFTDTQFFGFMPFSVLKELHNKPQNYPNVLSHFIKTWIESGKSPAAMFSKFTLYNIQPPSETGSQRWSVELLNTICPDISLKKQIRSLKEHIADNEQLLLAKHKKELSKLLTLARQENDAGLEALKIYISSSVYQRKVKLIELAIMLRHAEIKIPGTSKTNWQQPDITQLLIQWGMNTNDDQALFDMPIRAVCKANLPEERIACYLKHWIEAGKSIEALMNYNSRLINTAEKAASYNLVQLLMKHYPEGIQFPTQVTKVAETYKNAIDNDQTTISRTAAVELLFRAQFGDSQAFKHYLACMRYNKQEDKTVAHRLRQTGWPIPESYNTKDGRSGSCNWTPSNLRSARALFATP